MTSEMTLPTLASLEFVPYLDETGHIPTQFEGKVGVYAIFDESQALHYIGYSRDIYLSLKQHLVRQPQSCYWLKTQTIERPQRTILEEIRHAWVTENGSTPAGNGADADAWNQPMNAKATMSEAEKAEYQRLDELGQIKYLKKIARRLESEVLEKLKARGVEMELRFNPKLKEEGLLDLK
jgi:hypothetical protein